MDEGLRKRTTQTSRKELSTDEDAVTIMAKRTENTPTESNNILRPSSSAQHSELLISWRRILMLIMAVTVHNFPEGLAVGIGFGSIGKTPAATFEKAFNLALGIGLQNFPEGLAVSLPLASFGYSPFRAFLYGQLSGMVEPLAALLGSSAVLLMEAILPYALSFAAGAMIYVVFDSIIPEACSHGNGKMASAFAIIGFLVMMCLDVGLINYLYNIFYLHLFFCSFFPFIEVKMFKTISLSAPRRSYVDLDYARHMPKAYVERMKRTVPMRVYDNRFGAPPVIRWSLPPDDYKPLIKTFEDGTRIKQAQRSWEGEQFNVYRLRERDHKSSLFGNKFFRKGRKIVPAIPAEEWTIFPGDQVQVMVGADKNKTGVVSHVIKEENAVFVEGFHRKTINTMNNEFAKEHGIPRFRILMEQPLFVHKGEVKLIDPNDNEPCTAKWILNEEKAGYVRVSTRTGYEIPLPKTAERTYEYTTPEKYIEVEGKDTPANKVLLSTYEPKLQTFEEEIEQEMGLERREKINEKLLKIRIN
ncbi:KOW domain-containing protein [Meloidogyne graminicola]|uniref:Large ribosomal subunit protein uL24m n=1 Tax=Meloidogyne graminicola TaxID=189291 RepID=A0A8T0A1M9_9BILA|nr:KOW domain-containing protein [Meloidogyne graminicola]